MIAAAIVILAALRALLHRRERFEPFFRLLRGVEAGMIALLLGSLVILGGTQVVLRNFFHSGLLWADPLMRHIVLWLGCLGAAAATSDARQIHIDVFTRLLPKRARPARRMVVFTATAAAAFALGVAALRLVADERAFGDVAFGSLPIWVLQAVLPFSLFVISYRSLFNMLIGREGDFMGAEPDAPSLNGFSTGGGEEREMLP
jgi:TRAP-type C4-dicarboxylate transport system permease small subunit